MLHDGGPNAKSRLPDTLNPPKLNLCIHKGAEVPPGGISSHWRIEPTAQARRRRARGGSQGLDAHVAGHPRHQELLQAKGLFDVGSQPSCAKVQTG